MLAEGFGEPLTAERVEIYASGLIDIPQKRLHVAFNRALQELTWFPRLAELRNLAGAKTVDQNKVEADAAWDYVNKYLRKWGVDLLPLYSQGKKITAPPLDSRIDYALRRIGGLKGLNQVDAESWPFMYRDFCEAYTLAPVAELMAPQLTEQFGDRKLLGNMRQLAEGKTMEPRITKQESQGAVPSSSRGADLTSERRAELKRNFHEEFAKRTKG